MYVWIGLIGGSTLIGALCAMLIKKRWSIYVAGAVPWLIFLAALIYTEYLSDSATGGVGYWQLAQATGGTIAAAIGVVCCKITRYLFHKDISL